MSAPLFETEIRVFFWTLDDGITICNDAIHLVSSRFDSGPKPAARLNFGELRTGPGGWSLFPLLSLLTCPADGMKEKINYPCTGLDELLKVKVGLKEKGGRQCKVAAK